MTSVADARADLDFLRQALDRRRLARDGGAYALLLDPEAHGAGPLAGVPVAIKDLIDIAGTPTRCGSKARAEVEPARGDAPVVALLRAAGAAFVGKTALHEFAFGTSGVNDFEGTPRHPQDPERVCGGSSSGSALAVAEGSAAFALGTDTGGSVRIPAALCGVVGVKPSIGLLSLEGVFPLAPSLDHVGVLAADVVSAQAALAVLAPAMRWDAPPPRSAGLDERALKDAEPAVARAIEAALARFGELRVKQIKLPDPARVMETSTTILFYEAARAHERTLAERAGALGADVRARLERGAAITEAAYQLALADREKIRAETRRLLGDVEVFIGPTVGIVAPRMAEVADTQIAPRFVQHTRLANITELPAVTIPVPTDGLPVGLQLLARDDALALTGAAWLENVLR